MRNTGVFSCLADEDHAFGFGELAEMLLCDIVLALAFAELDHGNLLAAGKLLQRSHEGFADRVHEDAGSELVGAVEAVFQGKRYVSSRLKGVISAQAEDAHASDKPVHDELLASRLIRVPEMEFTRCHEVLFYSDDVVFLESVTHFIGAPLRFGNAAVVFATKPHRDMLFEELKAQGVDVDVLIQQGSYVSLDAADTLSKFMINGWPDTDRFFEGFKNLIESASKAANAKHPRVAIFGERVALLWAEGKRDAAIRLEQLGNDLAKTRKVDILCAYPSRLRIQEDKHSFGVVCGEHSAVRSR